MKDDFTIVPASPCGRFVTFASLGAILSNSNPPAPNGFPLPNAYALGRSFLQAFYPMPARHSCSLSASSFREKIAAYDMLPGRKRLLSVYFLFGFGLAFLTHNTSLISHSYLPRSMGLPPQPYPLTQYCLILCHFPLRHCQMQKPFEGFSNNM
jgi:hypothetical protein